MEIINIIVVEDDPISLKIMSKTLESGGYQVATAMDGEEALNMLKMFTPELVIADVKMPKIDGLELCQKLRQLGYHDIPFIFCSSLGDRDDRLAGLRVGADDYLVKPPDPDELLLKVNNLIAKSRRLHSLIRGADQPKPRSSLIGSLSDVPVTDLLQLLQMQRFGEIWTHFERQHGENGDIYIEDDSVIHAETGTLYGKKAFYRMLAWNSGSFEVRRQFFVAEKSMNAPLKREIFAGLVELDEYLKNRQKLEEQGTRFVLIAKPHEVHDEADTKRTAALSAITEFGEINLVIDAMPTTDGVSLNAIMKLIADGYVAVE